MTVQLHNTGEEFVLSQLDGEAVEVSLFDDSVDTLVDADDIGAITTEPTGSAFSRKTATVSLGQTSDGDATLEVNDLTFDVSDSSRTVDSVVVIVNFSSSQAGGGNHLFFTSSLADLDGTPQTVDLSRFEAFTINGLALTLD